MAVASIEMAPKVFPLDQVAGTFKAGDVVRLQGPKGDFQADVDYAKPLNVPRHPNNPLLGLKIMINRGDLSEFKNGGFANYTVTSRDGATGKVVEPPLLPYAGRLLKQTEMQKMLDAAESLIATAARLKSDGNARKWFGTKATTPAELAKIHRRCAELQQGVAGLATVVFQCANSETMGGVAPGDPLRNGPTCRMQLGVGVTYDRYSWGERVCTIVHELTHWFLETEDAKSSSNKDLYGHECILAAESDTDCRKVLNNADNWAFYICEYRSDNEAGDWRNFSAQELRDRPAFVSGAYNVDQSLIARYN
jgi:hypothetical protein